MAPRANIECSPICFYSGKFKVFSSKFKVFSSKNGSCKVFYPKYLTGEHNTLRGEHNKLLGEHNKLQGEHNKLLEN